MSNGWGLKANDAIHLATASHYGASEFFTYDEPVQKYGNYLDLRICAPYTDQGLLRPTT